MSIGFVSLIMSPTSTDVLMIQSVGTADRVTVLKEEHDYWWWQPVGKCPVCQRAWPVILRPRQDQEGASA